MTTQDTSCTLDILHDIASDAGTQPFVPTATVMFNDNQAQKEI